MTEIPDKKRDSTLLQIIGLLLLLVTLVIMSTVGTLIALGIIKTGDQPVSVNSITDAENVCDQRVRRDYQQQLNFMTVDDRSSRYDSASGRYKMFYELGVYQGNDHQSGVQTFYVSCYVSAKQGVVSRIDYLEQTEEKIKAIRRSHGNEFGL